MADESAAATHGLSSDSPSGQLSEPFVAPRRPSRRVYALCGTAAALLLVVLGGLYFVQRAFGPESAVEAYFDALAARDAGTALAQIDAEASGGLGPDMAPLLHSDLLKGDGYQPPELVNLEIGPDPERPDGGGEPDSSREWRKATVEYRIAEETFTDDLYVMEQEKATLGIVRRWKLAGGAAPLVVDVRAQVDLQVNGVRFQADESGGATVFLGGYDVTMTDNPLIEADGVTVAVGSDGGTASLEPRIRTAANEAVNTQVRRYIDNCARSTSQVPPDCPFRAYSYPTLTNVRWTISQYPTIAVATTQSGEVAVTTEQYGIASVTGKADGEAYDDEDQFEVRGTVTIEDGKVTFSPEM